MKRESRTFLLWALIFIFLACITFITYRDALDGGMVSDAGSYLLGNPYIAGLSWRNIKWMFSSYFMSNWHPLTWLSYAIDYSIYEKVWGLALTNILLHCANTVLVFFLAVLIIKNHYRKELLLRDMNYKDLLAAFTAALLFGIHPQHVESVAWLAERKDVLCQFFTLLTLISYIFYAQAELRKKRIYYYGLTLLFSVMASLSKPTAVTIPLLLLILDGYPLQRVVVNNVFRVKKNWALLKNLLLEKLPFFCIALMLAIITLVAQETAINLKISFLVRILNVFNSFIVYISKFILPINLMPLYRDFPNQDDFLSLIPVVAVILITAVFLYLWCKGQRYWLAAWLFYIIALLPMIGLVQVGGQSSADRYAYLPTTPFYILVGSGFSTLLFQRYVIVRVVFFIFLMGLSLTLFSQTQNQILIWKDNFSLWNHIVKVLPNHGVANSHLGDYYFGVGQYEKAIEHYYKASVEKGLVIPTIPKAAISLLRLGRLDEALTVYEDIVRKGYDVKISDDCIYYNIGLIYAKKGLWQKATQVLSLISEKSDFSSVAKKLLSNIKDMNAKDENVDKKFSTFPFCERFRTYAANIIYDNGVPVTEERY